ncbi:MAG: TIR domain-containing protein, partial [Chloroflexi bacterium]
MAHVFISYSRKDTDFVERLERALHKHHIVTWRDVHSIPGGANWFRRIEAGLQASYAVIYIDTPAADISKWVGKEYLYAEHLKLPIIPVKHDKTFMPMRTIDLNPVLCDDAHFDACVQQLVSLLQELPQEAIVPGAETPAPLPADEPVDDEAAPDMTTEIRTYLDWVELQGQADLQDALYVNLSASPEQYRPLPIAMTGWGGFGADNALSFDRLGLEHIVGEDFERAGHDVADAREPLRDLRRVILLGEPGSGKTTTLVRLAIDLARDARTALENDEQPKLPVFVPLRQFDGDTDFETFVRAQMYNLQDEYPALLTDKRLIVLLDALNEMPRHSADGRDLVDEVRDYVRDKPDWIVSCRIRDYQEQLSNLNDVGKVRLKALDPPRIYEVIQKRFAQIEQPELGEQLWAAMYGTDDLLKAWDVFVEHDRADAFWTQWPDDVKAADVDYSFQTPGFYDWYRMQRDKRRMMHLCRNPYMTNMVCRLYAISKQLPPNRGALFAAFVDNLLQRDRLLAEQVGAAWIDDALIRNGLARIAYTMGTETEMPRSKADAILREHLPDVDHDLLLRLAMGASLLDVGEQVRFTHQLLQEYFASLVLGEDLDNGLDPVAYWQAGEWWRPTGREETLIILAGVRGDPEAVARWVAPAQPELAVEILRDSGIPVALDDLDEMTRRAIVSSARDKTNEPNPIGRAAAYRALGLLGADDRKGIGVIAPPVGAQHAVPLQTSPLPDIEWSDEIAAGMYPIGGDAEAYKPLPGQQYEIKRPYRMAKYLVTYTQFQTFLDAPDGFDHDTWWDGLAKKKDAMYEQNNPYPNHPRERVSWYQAVAFSRWLTAQYREAGLLREGAVIRLPTEQEWEVA